jgi:hypothetical protein
MTATHVTVQSGQKCNEHVSIANMAKRDTQNILLLWKCWNSASCLPFIVTLGRCLCSFLLLKYRVCIHTASVDKCCLHCWGKAEKWTWNRIHISQSVLHQLGNTIFWTLWWSHFYMLHRVHKSVHSLTAGNNPCQYYTQLTDKPLHYSCI